jgi:hypothetical protein
MITCTVDPTDRPIDLLVINTRETATAACKARPTRIEEVVVATAMGTTTMVLLRIETTGEVFQMTRVWMEEDMAVDIPTVETTTIMLTMHRVPSKVMVTLLLLASVISKR